MPLGEPAWWYPSRTGPSLAALLLSPVGHLYGRIATARFNRVTPYRAPVPVICIGNFTVGGTGKTPMVRRVTALLRDLGREPVVLSRGYGGRQAGPHWVSIDEDTAADVGDEPLLLARDAPVLVSRDRAAGARAIVAEGGPRTVIVMDDGLQNPALAKDLTVAIVDPQRRFGNGRVFPAGPLRAPLAFQQTLVDAVVVNRAAGRTAEWADLACSRAGNPVPVLHAETRAAGETGWIGGQPIVAFAGIANPQRVYALLRRLGGDLVATRSFADHAPLTEADARQLIAMADAHAAMIVTTEKDMARLSGRDGAAGELRRRARAVAVELDFTGEHRERFEQLLRSALAAAS